jgi:hypothetical protein
LIFGRAADGFVRQLCGGGFSEGRNSIIQSGSDICVLARGSMEGVSAKASILHVRVTY